MTAQIATTTPPAVSGRLPLDGRVAAVTGATGLLDPAVATAFAASGAELALIARSEAHLEQLTSHPARRVREAPGAGGRHRPGAGSAVGG